VNEYLGKEVVMTDIIYISICLKGWGKPSTSVKIWKRDPWNTEQLLTTRGSIVQWKFWVSLSSKWCWGTDEMALYETVCEHWGNL